MCFFKKKIQNLEDSIKELTKIVKNREYLSLKEDSKNLKEIQKNLESVKIKVEEARIVLDQGSLEEVVVIKYSVPSVMIRFDENGDPIKDELFYAINSLNLISFEDMDKIRKIFHDQKIKKIQN